jgi:hypothetical protein
MATTNKSSGAERREKLRKEFWPNEDAWTGENEKGWFRAPRTLPLLLGLLGEKSLSGNQDPAKVYVELFARHIDGGVIEMGHEADHAFAAGYDGPRGVRTWRERMRTLEKLGVIRTRRVGNQDFKYVLLVHPTVAIKRLRDAGKVPAHWWDAYRARQLETKEVLYELRPAAKKTQKVVSMPANAPAKKTTAESA